MHLPKGCTKNPDDAVKIQVAMTRRCHRAAKQFAALRGMTLSHLFYLSTRYAIHKEALNDPSVRAIFEREGIQMDEDVLKAWEQVVLSGKNIDEVFTPRPVNLM